jgi:hypothetical protein
MPFNATAKNLMLDALSAEITHLSLHDGAPSTTGANEVSGGSPAYARQACAWDAAASGEADLTGDKTFDVPAATTVAHVGLFGSATGTTFYGSMPLDTPEIFGGQGNLTVLASGTSLAITDPA